MEMETERLQMDPQGDVVEIIADYGLGVLGVVRLLFTFLYCFVLTLLPLIAGTPPSICTR